MHSLLALSASHLAWLTGCPLAANIAFEHRGVALKGLHEAIGSFVRENSDAVLAASLLLSWQAAEWLVETKSGSSHLSNQFQAGLDTVDAWNFFGKLCKCSGRICN